MMDGHSAGAAGNFISPLDGLSANAFKTVIDIDMEYPRNRTSERFSELRTLLLEQFLDSHHS